MKFLLQNERTWHGGTAPLAGLIFIDDTIKTYAADMLSPGRVDLRSDYFVLNIAVFHGELVSKYQARIAE